MSQLNGGRIVPVLTGHDGLHPNTLDQQPTLPTPNTQLPSVNSIPPISSAIPEPLSDQTPKTMAPRSLDMPVLKERGFFALPINGDGNCLYYSLSDQLYANTKHADEIRQRLADHMAANKDYFMQFVSAGGERRRPKRAAASAYATRSADVSAPTEQDKESRFQEMIATTRKNAEWGSSEHIQAFCQAYKLDVNVYTKDGLHLFQDVNSTPAESRNVVHIAFHDFKHYSSVRSIKGTHKGLFAQSSSDQTPKVAVKAEIKPETKPQAKLDSLSDEILESKDNLKTKLHDVSDEGRKPEMNPQAKLDGVSDGILELEKDPKTKPNGVCGEVLEPTNNPETKLNGTSAESRKSNIHSDDSLPPNDTSLAVDVYAPWDIKSIQEGLGGRYDRETIIDMLQKCRGDIDRAFAALLDEKAGEPAKKSVTGIPVKPSLQASRETSPFSTGSKRSADDSDDSEAPQPARRVRPRRRILSNVTFGVGISFRDDQDDVVSLNLRVPSETEQSQATDSSSPHQTTPEHSDVEKRKCRRSGRLSRAQRA